MTAAPHPPIAVRWAPPSRRKRAEGLKRAPSLRERGEGWGDGQQLTIRAPLSPAGGGEITGIDLSRPLSDEARGQIYAVLLGHQFLIFRGQALSREQQYAFTAQFGEVEAHGGGRPGKRQDVAHVTANLDADGNPSDRFAKGANYRWHTDKPYYRTPPALTT
ncbi:MAG TPA: TauD/TfdA family dioxygenase, partial [Stellaceae bacterium]|nr:TauD/TfdA family dioxygenase [Stellaceae bacterium]